MNTQKTITLFAVLGLFWFGVAVVEGAALLPAAEATTILERALNHRVVQSASGGTYTELGDGLCYEENGVLKDSEDTIELSPNGNGAVASKGRHKVSFPPSIGSPISVTLPDGTRWVTKPFGLAYFNSLDGSSVLIAELADVVGELHPPNQVIYPKAVPEAGADIRYTYSRGSFAQDLIVRSRLPDPMLWNFPPEFTRVEFWTEILEAPVISKTPEVVKSEEDAEVRAVMAAPDVIDEALTFSAAGMHIGKGKAFPINNTETSIPVSKQTVVIDGRHFLIETIEYPAAEPILKTLPAADQVNAAIWKQRKARPRSELLAGLRPKQPQQRAQRPAMKVAQATIQGPALVADYDLYFNVSYTDFTFIADHTYAIYGQLTLGGTTTLEGAVIKFPPYNPSVTCQIKISGTGAKINCITAPYRPAIFTGRDDDTVGEILSYSTGTLSGNYGNYAIYFDSSAMVPSSLHDIRVRNTAIYYATGSGHLVRHSQFVGGLKAIDGSPSVSVRLQNVLFSVYQPFNVYVTARGENLTISGYALGGSSVWLTNSLINVTATPSYSGPNNFSVASSAFQTVGAGYRYLADDTYRNVGTSAIDPGLLGDLRKRTTYPPAVLSSDFTSFTILEPTPIADTDLIDAGYHYDILNYAWSERTLSSLSSSATLLLTNGVAIAHFGPRGTTLGSGGRFISEGSPLQHNVLVPYTAVQETATFWGTAGSTFSILGTSGTQVTPAPEIYLRFTDVSFPASLVAKRKLLDHANANLPQSVTLRDCEISSAYMIISNSQPSSTALRVDFINNLLRRCEFTLRRDDATGADNALIDANVYNNLLLNSTLRLLRNTPDGNDWHLHDNLFDSATISFGSGTINKTHNAYLNTSGYVSGNGNQQITVRDYQTGPLGTNYYPTTGTGLKNLLNAGSRTVSLAGLYHYSMKPDGSKEGPYTPPAPEPAVSIGYHYVGLTSQNLAVNRYASQSSTANGGEAKRAVDGNTSGSYSAITQTLSENQPWWQLDLGQIESIQSINVWNRTDCCGANLSNFYLLLSDDPFTSTTLSTTLAQPGVSSYYMSGQAGTPSTFLVNRTARYVRVQLSGANVLSLAEVQVNTSSFPSDQEHDGIADYLEDSNGDGLVSTGESNYQGPIVTITAPVDGFAINTMRINVQGTVTHTSPLQEISVNGVRAFLNGTTFDGLNVPLAIGANLVLARAVDRVGNVGTAQINISGVPSGQSLVDPIVLSATPIAGFDPLTVTFNPTIDNLPGTIQEVRYDFVGNNATVLGALGPVNQPYTVGQYFPVITIQTTLGKFSSTGGWNDPDIHRLRINVQTPPVALAQNVIVINDPVDLKTTAAGHLYVLSRADRSITQYDANGAVVRSLFAVGAVGSAPRGLDVDAIGCVYVAVSGENQIAKFKPITGSFQLDSSFGTAGVIGKSDKTSGSGDGEFNAPSDVAVAPDGLQIAVADSGNHRIQYFTRAGVYTGLFGEQGGGTGQLNTPRGITCDDAGHYYIVDSGNNRIVLMTLSALTGTSGASGAAIGQFQGPLNVGVGSRGIYVADAGNNRVQSFDPVAAGHGIEPTPLNPRSTVSTLSGLTPSTLNQPNAVAQISDLVEERIYIADTANNRVILVKLPSDNPKPAWDSMKARLLANDIEGAIPYFSELSANKYRQVFLSIGTSDLNPIMSQVPEIVPVYVGSDTAQYVFDQLIQGFTISFPIEFIKENGTWKILEY